MDELTHNGWYIRCRQGRGMDCFIAWASPEPLTADGPLGEHPAKLIYFQIGGDEQETIDALKAEIDQVVSEACRVSL